MAVEAPATPVAEPSPSLDGFAPVYNKETTQYEMTETEKQKLLKYLNAKHDKEWMAQAEGRRRWKKLKDYVKGRQAYDSNAGYMVGHEIAASPSADNDIDDKYYIINMIRRLHNSNVQRLSGYTIQPMVIPNTTDPDDKEAATLGRIALANFYDEQGDKKIKSDIATIVDTYGSVFQKTFFDPEAGRLVHPLVQDISPLTGEPGEVRHDMDKLVPEGEVVVEYWGPDHILLPINTCRFKDADHLEEVHVETCNWAWRTFKVKVDAEDINSRTAWGPVQRDTDHRDIEYAQGTIENSIVFKARYINPCPEFIHGAIIQYCRKHIFRCTALTPYFDKLQEIWATASAIKDENSPFGDTWLWDEIPVQDTLNTAITSTVNYVEGYGMLQAQVSENAQLKVDKIDNASMRIFTYRGEKGLEPINHAALPGTHSEVIGLMMNLSESLGAAHDIRRPTGTPSGNAINSLRQIDDSMLRPCVESIGEMLSAGAKTALKLMGEHYKNPRLQKMLGREGWIIQDDFTGAALRGNFNARINLLTGLSDDPGVRQESVLKLKEAGIIKDEAEARSLLGMDNNNEILERLQKENEVANRFVKGMADYPRNYDHDPMTGQEVCLTQWHPEFDNHALIIQKDIEWMRENFDHAEKVVQQTFMTDLQRRQQWMAALSMPPGEGEGIPAEAHVPEGALAEAPGNLSAPGKAPAPKTPGADSRQHPSQQPPRPAIAPASTGSAQVRGQR